LLGLKAGEERDFDFVFEGGMPVELNGKTAHFHVTVHMGTKQSLAEVNDEFLAKCGVNSVADLNEKLVAIIKSRVDHSESSFIRNQVATKLLEDNEVKIPEFLITSQAEHICRQHGRVYQKLSAEEQKAFKDESEKQVKLSLILDSVREKEPNAVINDAEAYQALIRRANIIGEDPKKFVAEAQRDGSIGLMIAALKDEFTLQYVANQVKEKNDAERA
jgi:FKBP-type peptidyl-prolyl cis-trans isomerase (trigger factor)